MVGQEVMNTSEMLRTISSHLHSHIKRLMCYLMGLSSFHLVEKK